MDIIFDTATGQLSINQVNIASHGANIRALLERHGQTINLRGVQMRLTITADGQSVFDLSLPPPNVRYSKTNQNTLANGQVRWKPEQAIHVMAWCLTSNKQEVTAEATFTAPRPLQPYPSWTWDGSQWQPPTPMPDDGKFYQWDEASLSWQEIEATP